MGTEKLQLLLAAPRTPENCGVLPKIECADGFKMSVQASRTHYCTPRTDTGPWSHVEVGFPTEREELLMEYVEDADRPTSTVYGYVPVEVIVAVIDKHGGLL